MSSEGVSSDVPGCLACDLARGRAPLPGGVIAETDCWLVEHCVGPLGVGTLIVKPKRHITRVSEMNAAEATEVGRLLHRSAAVIDDLIQPEQIYVCLWSHAGGRPVHIHYVVQPVTAGQMTEHGAHGPFLQTAMFERGEQPSVPAVEAFADRARRAFPRRA